MVAQVHKVEFDRGTNARDLQEQLAVVAGYNRYLGERLQQVGLGNFEGFLDGRVERRKKVLIFLSLLIIVILTLDIGY